MTIIDHRLISGALLLLLLGISGCQAEGMPPEGEEVGCMQIDAQKTASSDNNIVSLQNPTLVSLASPASAAPVISRAAFGHVVSNPVGVHDVNATISGQIEEVFVRVGSSLRKGDPVASVSSPDFVFTQMSYLTLLGDEERLAVLREEGNLPNFLKDARENLKWWGMDEKAIDDLGEKKKVIQQLSITAPEDGIVTEVFVRPGDVIDAGDRTMQKFIVLGRAVARMVSDQSSRLLEVYAYADRFDEIEPGVTRIRVKPPRGGEMELTVSYTLPVDAATQTALAVIDLENVDHSLTIGEKVPVEILLPAQAGVWVPTSTVLRQGLRPVVFVQKGDGRFERRVLDVLEMSGSWIRVGNVEPIEKLVKDGKTILEGTYRQQNSGAAELGHGLGHHH
jgi:multidrug efflux pump subunit AcrA (membrane-fusion protein)